MAFVSPEKITITSEVLESLEIEKRDVQAVVFEVGIYNGFNRTDLWEWLRKVQS